MKQIRRGFIFLWLIVAAVLAVSVLTHLNSYSFSKNHKETVYYCPMHPAYTSNKPGNCPICNMTLVPRKSDSGTAHKDKSAKAADICYMHNCPMMKPGEQCPMMVVAKAGEEVVCPVCGKHVVRNDSSPEISKEKFPEGYVPILVSPEKKQFIGVRTGKIEKRVISKTIRTAGRIAYDPELYQAEQEYISAFRAARETEKRNTPDTVENAKRLVDAAQMRLKILGFNKELIDELSTQEIPDKSLLLTDPSGKAWLYAPIYEYELPLVQVGQNIDVEVPSAPGRKLTGKIRAIDSILDPMTRTARVRATLVDADGILKPEMYVDASIAVNSGEVLALPEEALFDTGVKKIVFVDKGNGIFEPRAVQVGFKADGFYEIKEGLSEGEGIVTSGNFLIDSESRLKAALEGMGDRESH